MSNQLIVTRHKSLLRYLKEHDIVDKDAEHLTYAHKEDVIGKDVFGILPMHLACYANSLTELMLRLPPDKRGKELLFEELEFYKPKPITYIVRLKEKEE